MKNYVLSAFLIILTLCVIIFLGCKEKLPTESGLAQLINTTWTLESFGIDASIIKPPADQLYTIQFKEDSTASGKVDCNNFFASYLITSGNTLKIEWLGATEMACGNNNSLSDYYMHGLNGAKLFKIRNKKLYIYYDINSSLIFYGE